MIQNHNLNFCAKYHFPIFSHIKHIFQYFRVFYRSLNLLLILSIGLAVDFKNHYVGSSLYVLQKHRKHKERGVHLSARRRAESSFINSVDGYHVRSVFCKHLVQHHFVWTRVFHACCSFHVFRVSFVVIQEVA